MSYRLQVLLNPKEVKTFRHLAKDAGLTLSDWVRQTLREAADHFSTKSPEAKLKAIREVAGRAAPRHIPSGDIEDILAEIEKGYLS